jgi:hypothetical protein
VQQALVALAARDLLLALAMESGLITIPCGHNQLLFVCVKDEPLADHDLPGGDGNGTASQCTLPSCAAGDGEMRDGLGIFAGNKETPLDLSIAKARAAWRIFEVKHLQYILFGRRSAGGIADREREIRRGRRGSLVFDCIRRMQNPNSIANSARSTYDHCVR